MTPTRDPRDRDAVRYIVMDFGCRLLNETYEEFLPAPRRLFTCLQRYLGNVRSPISVCPMHACDYVALVRLAPSRQHPQSGVSREPEEPFVGLRLAGGGREKTETRPCCRGGVAWHGV